MIDNYVDLSNKKFGNWCKVINKLNHDKNISTIQ